MIHNVIVVFTYFQLRIGDAHEMAQGAISKTVINNL